MLVEELEAHLHPQLQMKLLKYLSKQAEEYDIQVIITTHSTTLAAATPINQIICFSRFEDEVFVTPISKCELDKKAENFINRWLDATKSTLLFSKGNILVEGLAEAILAPKLAEIYLKNRNDTLGISTLEDAGASVINMNGIYFQHFMQLYNGYRLNLPEKETGEAKSAYEKRMQLFVKKESFEIEEYREVPFIKVRCTALTDNDPINEKIEVEDPEKGNGTIIIESKPTKYNELPSGNPQMYLKKQLEKMTDNCRVYTNLKIFEYDLAIESHSNAKIMLEIISKMLQTDGKVKTKIDEYLKKIADEEAGNVVEIDDAEMALFILQQIDSSYLGKGLFAQLLCDRIDDSFVVPDYIKKQFALY